MRVIVLVCALSTLATGCWSLDGLYDPGRCDPPCGAGQRCMAGACVAVTDARVDAPGADAAHADAPSADAGGEDSAWADAGDLAAHDGPGIGDAADATAEGSPDGPALDSVVPDSVVLDGLVPAIGWTLIKKGSFTMGSPTTEACRGQTNKETQHQVTLTHDFQLMTTEVSQQLFQALMGYNNAWHGPGGFGGFAGYDRPVEYLTWHEAAAFCNALSKAQGLGQCYSCSGGGLAVSCTSPAAWAGSKIYDCPGFRLSTEAEWEYAYRAGTTTALYSGVDLTNNATCDKDLNASKICWYKHTTSATKPVGTLPPNPWGLYNMAGNATEWCHDEFVKDLGSAAVTDPVTWGTKASGHVLRGGNYDSKAYLTRAAWRGDGLTAQRTRARGLRCARTK